MWRSKSPPSEGISHISVPMTGREPVTLCTSPQNFISRNKNNNKENEHPKQPGGKEIEGETQSAGVRAKQKQALARAGTWATAGSPWA